jgi:hypothetical protein
VETSVPLLTCRSYPLSVEDAYCRRRIFTVTRAFLAVAYAILVRTRFALCGSRLGQALGRPLCHLLGWPLPAQKMGMSGHCIPVLYHERVQPAQDYPSECRQGAKKVVGTVLTPSHLRLLAHRSGETHLAGALHLDFT